MNNKKIIIFFFPFLLSSCIKESEIKIPSIKSKLVVNSLFTPDSSFTVYVNHTTKVYDTSKTYIDNATVQLFSNGGLIETIISMGNGLYKSNFYPTANTEYEVKVKANSYDDVEAINYIPQKVQIQDAYWVIKGTDEYGDPIHETTVIFNDPPDEENYYEVILLQRIDSSHYIYYGNYTEQPINDPAILAEGDWDYKPTTFFFSDNLFNGKQYSLKIPGGGGSFDNDSTSVNGTYAVLKTVSKEYYLFRKYWTRHYFNQNNDQHLDDPLTLLFLGEPIEMYTNVQNGYGIFAGYSQAMKKLKYISK